MTFLLAISRPTPYGGGLRQLALYKYIYIYILIHSGIDLKWIILCYYLYGGLVLY